MKSPAFQVYVNDFLGSAKVGMMSTEEIGAYWLLLFLEWQEIGFVYNEQQLSRWCRLTPSRFKKAWVALKPCFVEIDGRLYNPRLQKEREKQEAWRDKSAKGGKKSGEARTKGGSRVVEPTPQPNTNTPLPLQVTTETTTPADADLKGFAFMGFLRPVWREVYGGDLPPGSAKRLKPTVGEHGVSEVARRLRIYCESTPAAFASVPKFVSTFGNWGKQALQNGERMIGVGHDPTPEELASIGIKL